MRNSWANMLILLYSVSGLVLPFLDLLFSVLAYFVLNVFWGFVVAVVYLVLFKASPV